MSDQLTISTGEEKICTKKIIHKKILTDRKSVYSVVFIPVKEVEQVKKNIQKLLQEDKYFKKSTHNSYAYRVKNISGSITEGKNDDGETGAGMCILREMQRENIVDGIWVVTRYFWGIKLHADRFKNIITSCQDFFQTHWKYFL